MIPQLTDLREEILKEFHCSRFALHPSGSYEIFGIKEGVVVPDLLCIVIFNASTTRIG